MTAPDTQAQADKPWHARAICCGRDDGTHDFATRGEAEMFRSQYTAGAGVAGPGLPGGHDRSVIITGPADQSEREAGTALVEYLEAMRADKGMRGMIEECIALCVEVRANLTAETLRADRAENARDQVGRMLHAAQERLTSVLVVAEQVRRYADWPGIEDTATHPEVVESLRVCAAALLRELTPGRRQDGPTREAQRGAGDVERCAHCGKPLVEGRTALHLGARVCHTGTLPPHAHPTDCYRLLADGEQLGCRDLRDYRDKLADRLIDQHRAAASLGRADGERTTPPACPDCEMPETNCACG